MRNLCFCRYKWKKNEENFEINRFTCKCLNYEHCTTTELQARTYITTKCCYIYVFLGVHTKGAFIVSEKSNLQKNISSYSFFYMSEEFCGKMNLFKHITQPQSNTHHSSIKTPLFPSSVPVLFTRVDPFHSHFIIFIYVYTYMPSAIFETEIS